MERLVLSKPVQLKQHKKKKPKKRKKKNKQQQQQQQQQQRGDGHNPSSRVSGAYGDDRIGAFVKRACELLQEKKRRIFMWEATLLLGTHFMQQALQQALDMAPAVDAREAFWSIVQAKAGLEQYKEIVARAAGKRQPRGTLRAPPDTASGNSSPVATPIDAGIALLDLNCNNKRSFEVVIRDLDEQDQEAQRLEEEQERKRLKMQEAIQDLSVRFEAVNFAA